MQARSRFSDDSIVAYKYSEALLQSIKPANIYFVFTQCDLIPITDAYIPAYLKNFTDAKMTVIPENSIRFNMTIEALEVFKTALKSTSKLTTLSIN